ncbi:OmpA family protein [Oxalobacteraceae sp. CFBP 13730]|nr:OmpA family protein [Oxalobacteraceae sp. CFBP 13730]
MKTTLTLLACAVLAGAGINVASAAGQDRSTVNSDTIDPDWANSAWYAGAGLGQGRAKIDDERIGRSLTANGASLESFTTDQRDLGYKVFVGKKFNRYFAVEAGYFDIGKFGFQATTSGNGNLRGETSFRGVNLDLIGYLPLTPRLSALARVGGQYGRSTAHFSGNRLNGVTAPNPEKEEKFQAKVGLGLQYQINDAWAVRGEIERYRLRDPLGNRGEMDLASISLIRAFGRPAARPIPAPEPVVMQPEVQPVAPVVQSAPQPVSEKVSFAAEALFDFDRAVVKPEGKAGLDELMSKLQGMDTEVMIAVGHTDSVGSDAYNQALSLRRADAVKAYLVSKGLDQARLYTEGKGETQPVADNATAEGRAKNRRVVIEVVGTRTSR